MLKTGMLTGAPPQGPKSICLGKEKSQTSAYPNTYWLGNRMTGLSDMGAWRYLLVQNLASFAYGKKPSLSIPENPCRSFGPSSQTFAGRNSLAAHVRRFRGSQIEAVAVTFLELGASRSRRGVCVPKGCCIGDACWGSLFWIFHNSRFFHLIYGRGVPPEVTSKLPSVLTQWTFLPLKLWSRASVTPFIMADVHGPIYRGQQISLAVVSSVMSSLGGTFDKYVLSQYIVAKFSL